MKTVGRACMAVLVGWSCLVIGSCNDDDDSNNAAFTYSCRDISGQLCDNYYGEMGGGQADCVGNGGTHSTSKCSAMNVLGVCTLDAGTFGYVETVFYNNQPPDTNPEVECALIGGSWSSTYNP